MSSFNSSSSFGGRRSSTFSDSSSSDFGLSKSPSDFSRMPKFDEESGEPLDHPVLSSFNRDVVVAGDFGLAKMQVRLFPPFFPRVGGQLTHTPVPQSLYPCEQTKSAWEKQMAAFDKSDKKKEKKDARKSKHHPKVVEVPLTKGQKKMKKKQAEEGDDDDE